MAGNVTTKSQRRLLLNAESFGFGPTAAIADIFVHLRRYFEFIGYIGDGHTLDLQRKLPYDAVHDLSGLSADEKEKELERIMPGYDFIFTALDFAVAKTAHRLGLKVGIYDPLLFFWKEIPEIVKQCDLYVAQDFFGVRERIAAEPEKFATPHVVPPVTSDIFPLRGTNRHVLVNLGGLTNPYWTQRETLAYARLIVESFCSIKDFDEVIVIASNAIIAESLKSFGAKNYTREEMQSVLQGAKFALMTPGLGNIYDAARFGVPTIWLPPANDSQGQQLRTLAENGMVDASIDWSDFLPGDAIDYRDDQTLVLQQIASAIAAASSDKQFRIKLTALFAEQVSRINSSGFSKCMNLKARFGTGGAKRVSELVLAQANKERR